MGLGRPVVPIDWRLEVLGSQERPILSPGGPTCATCEASASVWVLSSPPWLPTQHKRQTTGTARWLGYVRWPGACFCGTLGGLEGFGGPLKPARPSVAVTGRVDFLGVPTLPPLITRLVTSLVSVRSAPQT